MIARGRTLRGLGWAVYLVLGAALCALYVGVSPLQGSGPLMNLIGLSPVLAILVGIRLHRPASRLPWLLLAAGSALFWLGDLYTYSYPHLLGAEVPFPSPGDALYVAMYPVMMAGLLLLVRRRNAGSDRNGLVDGLILTVGLSLPAWIALMAPYLHLDDLSLLAKIVSVAYPIGDVVLIGAVVRLALDAGRREPAFHLLTGSIVLLLITDFAYGLLTLHGLYDHQLWLDAGWIGSYLLWGAAGLHPSMARLDQPAAGRDAVLTRFRLALLTCASLVAPVIGIVHDLRVGDFDYTAVRAASIVLFGLVVVRMAGLVRQQERSLERERLLSGAGAELVAATQRDEIDRVAVGAAGALATPGAAVALCRNDEAGALRVAAVAGSWAAEPGETLGVEHLGDAAAEGEAVVRLTVADTLAAGLPPTHSHLLVVTLAPRKAEPAALLVAAEVDASKAERAAVRALASQVALALDSAVLSEEVHRRRGEARFGSLVRHASDLITVLEPDTTVSYQSPSIERILGYAPEDLLGQRFDRLAVAGDRDRLASCVAATAAGDRTQPLECALTSREGDTRHFEILFTNLIDDEHVGGILLNARDVSERKAFEAELAHQAFHDPVTGLANRAMFAEQVRQAIARARREGRVPAVIFLDLDDFKTVNDSLGHAAGDEVLVEFARRFDDSIRGADVAARFGGDEFALLIDDVSGSQAAADAAQRILELLARPMQAGHRQVMLSGSIGISIFGPEDVRDADELIRDADAAMYIAKRDGKGGYRLFEPAMHEGVVARLELRNDLQRALATDEFELRYQPVVRLADGTVSGVEALLRWRHPDRGLISPADFIPIAEETGLIIPIGRWVLREGCRHARRLEAPDGRPLRMSVNLSLKQIQHSDIVADVRDALEEARLAPERLTLEITESVLMDDTELAVSRLRDLKALGVTLALDDFGTGYSSLSYLSRFPVDILKMDRSFLSEGSTPDSNSLANAVVGLGATLALEVVAEGIEVAEQAESLRALGCDLGQGFLFARPLEAEDSLAFVAGRPRPARDAT
ncbi:MAG: putative bifunctional diguanylate cyclase/phosphodiesterase [Solirubrobacteraceae bacterium]